MNPISFMSAQQPFNYYQAPEVAGSMAYSAPAEVAGSMASASCGSSSSSSDGGSSFCTMG